MKIEPNTAKCPECFEPVHPEATKCKHCTADIYYCPYCQTQVTVSIKHFRTSGWSWDESAMGFCSKCDNQIIGPKKSNCFIATAAYGTPLALEVGVLCHIRDKHLSEYALGKAFVKTYELISPPIANFISERRVLRWLIRLGLRPIILICNRKEYKR